MRSVPLAPAGDPPATTARPVRPTPSPEGWGWDGTERGPAAPRQVREAEHPPRSRTEPARLTDPRTRLQTQSAPQSGVRLGQTGAGHAPSSRTVPARGPSDPPADHHPDPVGVTRGREGSRWPRWPRAGQRPAKSRRLSIPPAASPLRGVGESAPRSHFGLSKTRRSEGASGGSHWRAPARPGPLPPASERAPPAPARRAPPALKPAAALPPPPRRAASPIGGRRLGSG